MLQVLFWLIWDWVNVHIVLQEYAKQASNSKYIFFLQQPSIIEIQFHKHKHSNL